MGQENYEVSSLSGNPQNNEESNTFKPPQIDYGFSGVMPVPAISLPAMPISDVSLPAISFEYTPMGAIEEMNEQNRIVKKALSDEIANGDINRADIDYEARKQITDYYKRSEGDQEGKEYLVRGALLRCSCGTNSRKLNLSPCHGVYFKEHPLVHMMDCRQGEGAEDNITWYGVCDKEDLETEKIVVVDDNGENQTGKRCCPEIIGSWRNTYGRSKIASNHTASEEYELYDALTMDSYLICRHGGIITPVDSGQSREVQLDEFKEGKEAYDRVMGQSGENAAEDGNGTD